MKTRCSASAQKNRTELQASICPFPLSPLPNLSCLTARRRSGAQAPLDAVRKSSKGLGWDRCGNLAGKEARKAAQQFWKFSFFPILPIEHGYGPPSGPLPSTSRQYVNTRWAVLECYRALTRRQTPTYSNKGICLLSTGYLYLFSGPHRLTC